MNAERRGRGLLAAGFFLAVRVVVSSPSSTVFGALSLRFQLAVRPPLDNKKQNGRLDCKDCGQHFTCDTNHLTEAIDIYSEWIDACKDVNPDDVSDQGGRSPSPEPARGRLQKKRTADDDEEEEEEEELPDYRRKKGAQQEDDEEEEEDLPEPKRRKQGRVEDDEDDDE
ncbi:hypothetical protein BCR35DRAFT_326623 [Leucosporidium creatinivorum]|uniref:Transcription elongation factor 1 homolog n=1 Tax=Leucosporidium creatinivorum TaxID=106004 RepID=A0A1Y2DX76_9BASI|nr:hypothetical protein BCR35DRAFT_326623 [Leucosporidium creatinivorum]